VSLASGAGCLELHWLAGGSAGISQSALRVHCTLWPC
jgi:hypothetical protein